MNTLRPILSDSTRQLLDLHGRNFFELLTVFGSPLFILFPDEFAINIQRFREVFANKDFETNIFFAAKVNKAKCFVDVVVTEGIGVDVAGYEEFVTALAAGCSGKRIAVSGVEKSDELLALAVRHGSIISIDTESEWIRLANIVSQIGHGCFGRTLLRFSGFELDSNHGTRIKEDGRFGFNIDQSNRLIASLRVASANNLIVEGASFHLDNFSLKDRDRAIRLCVDFCLNARQHLGPCNLIDVGGGFPIQYVEKSDWQSFLNANVSQLTNPNFRNRDFGICQIGDVISTGILYPDCPEHTSSDFFRALLEHKPEGGLELADLLIRSGVEVCIEPGRSLLDQCGMSVCEIISVKNSTSGALLVVCDMNISHMWDQLIGSEFAVDPILIKRQPAESEKSVTVHLVGNSCLETDVISWRPIALMALPERGDLLCFINTAGYQMDFIESAVHKKPKPERLVAFKLNDQWFWTPDSKHSGIKNRGIPFLPNN